MFKFKIYVKVKEKCKLTSWRTPNLIPSNAMDFLTTLHEMDSLHNLTAVGTQHERKLFNIKELKNSPVGRPSDSVINDKGITSCMSLEIFHHIHDRCQTYPSHCQYTIVTGQGVT